jgi:CxxC-x17-CxxC domain-containing protein
VEFTDRQIPCSECHKLFTFTAGEQRWYNERGFEHPPRRCGDCRKARKERDGREGGGGGRGRDRDRQRPKHRITCARCGVEAEVPFEPRSGSPVYCASCFQANRQRG